MKLVGVVTGLIEPYTKPYIPHTIVGSVRDQRRRTGSESRRRALADDEALQHLLTQVQQRQAQQHRATEVTSNRLLVQRDAIGGVLVEDSDSVAIAAGSRRPTTPTLLDLLLLKAMPQSKHVSVLVCWLV